MSKNNDDKIALYQARSAGVFTDLEALEALASKLNIDEAAFEVLRSAPLSEAVDLESLVNDDVKWQAFVASAIEPRRAVHMPRHPFEANPNASARDVLMAARGSASVFHRMASIEAGLPQVADTTGFRLRRGVIAWVGRTYAQVKKFDRAERRKAFSLQTRLRLSPALWLLLPPLAALPMPIWLQGLSEDAQYMGAVMLILSIGLVQGLMNAQHVKTFQINRDTAYDGFVGQSEKDSALLATFAVTHDRELVKTLEIITHKAAEASVRQYEGRSGVRATEIEGRWLELGFHYQACIEGLRTCFLHCADLHVTAARANTVSANYDRAFVSDGFPQRAIPRSWFASLVNLSLIGSGAVEAGYISGAFTSAGLALPSVVALGGVVMAGLHAVQACLLWNKAQQEVKASPSEGLVASQTDQVFGQFLTEDNQNLFDRLAAELTLLKAQWHKKVESFRR